MVLSLVKLVIWILKSQNNYPMYSEYFIAQEFQLGLGIVRGVGGGQRG